MEISKMTSIGLVIVNGRGSTALTTLFSNSDLERFSEIVVVNVGKTKIQKSTITHQRLKIVDSCNTLCVNINRLIGATHILNSDYVLFLDDDDLINSKGIPKFLDQYICILGGEVYDKDHIRSRDLRKLTSRTQKMCLWGGFSRAIILRSLAIRKLSSVAHMVSFQDQALWITLASDGLRPHFVDENIVKYFVNSSSISTKPWRAVCGFMQLFTIVTKSSPGLMKRGLLLMCIVGIFQALIKRIIIRNIFK